MSDIVLYHALFSTCSQKVRYVLGKKQLAFKSHVVDLAKAEHLEDWYLRINPNGVVPSLSHGAFQVHDSSVVCEYLDEVFPDISLTPKSSFERAQMRVWMRYFEEVPTAAIRMPSFNKVFSKQFNQIPKEERDRRVEKMPLRKQFYKNMGENGFAQSEYQDSIDKLESCLVRVEKGLADEGPFLLGQDMTLADIVLLPSVVRMSDLGLEAHWRDKPHLGAWLTRMEEDRAFEIAFPEGTRLVI